MSHHLQSILTRVVERAHRCLQDQEETDATQPKRHLQVVCVTCRDRDCPPRRHQ